MQNDYESQAWAENVREFSKAVGEFFATVKLSMERLNAKQFDAPWRYDEAHRTCGG